MAEVKNQKQIYWPTVLFFSITPLVAVVALPLYLLREGVPLAMLTFTLVYAALTNLSITAGYHRLWAHKSFEAHPAVRFVLLLISASAFQGSALKWSSDHRRHHAKVDSDGDPYSIKRGFWHAHMGWMFWRETVDQPVIASDLERDPMVALQDKYYMPLAIIMGFGVPTWVGLFLGSPWAGLLFGGAVRILLTQQSTFFVNSLSHTLGKRPYCETVSARDSILVALLTHGEGYHNFHHRFQVDYRNGIRWYHWDPTKWAIWILAKLGLAKRLRKVSDLDILTAKLDVDSLKLRARGFSDAKLLGLKERIVAHQARILEIKKEIMRYQEEAQRWSGEHRRGLQIQLREVHAQMKRDLELWRRMLTDSYITRVTI